MPAYGRKPASGKTRRVISRLRPEGKATRMIRSDEGRRGKRVLIEKPWGNVTSTLDDVCKALRTDLRERVRFHLNRKPNPVIVNWGCGKGFSITKLQEKFPSTECYGFADEYFHEWEQQDKVLFLQGVAGNFFRYMKLTVKKPIDLLYSSDGLRHLSLSRNETKKYLEKLGNFLSVEGEMIFNIQFPKQWPLKELDPTKFRVRSMRTKPGYTEMHVVRIVRLQ